MGEYSSACQTGGRHEYEVELKDIAVITKDVDPEMVVDGGEETVDEMYEAPGNVECDRQREENDAETKLNSSHFRQSSAAESRDSIRNEDISDEEMKLPRRTILS